MGEELFVWPQLGRKGVIAVTGTTTDGAATMRYASWARGSGDVLTNLPIYQFTSKQGGHHGQQI
jgi:hypothetical protein